MTTTNETVSNGSSSNAASLSAIGLYGSNGLEYEAVPLFKNGDLGGNVIAYGGNRDTAFASYGTEDGGATSSLVSVDFSSTMGDWSSASLGFIYGSHTISSISVSGGFGSDVYQTNSEGQSTEIFKNSGGVETESITTGTFTDPSTGKPVTGTELTTYSGNSSTTTIYKSGDPSAPTFQFPSDAPTDYASAANLWSGLISSRMAEGSSGSAVSGVTRSVASAVRPIASRPAELAMASSHAGP